MTRTHRLILRAFAVWTVYVWGTRIWNTIGDGSRSFAFKAVHVALALVSVAFAVAAWVVVSQIRRNQAAPVTAEDPSGRRNARLADRSMTRSGDQNASRNAG